MRTALCMKRDLALLQKTLGTSFFNEELLETALTHRSYLNENRRYHLDHNERLEFLGDAVLELVVTEYLFHHYPNPEGELTAWRAALVRGEMLARVSRGLGVEKFLLMSRGEAKDTGRAREYLLANACEAIIGALYLDKGYEEAKIFILKHIVTHIDEVFDKKLFLDPKSHFQEKAQERAGITPSYREHEAVGPDHDKKFVVGAYLHDELVATGEGPSKQEAQRQAARAALAKKGWE